MDELGEINNERMFCNQNFMHVSIGKYNKSCVVETPKNWKLSDKSKKEVKVA